MSTPWKAIEDLDDRVEDLEVVSLSFNRRIEAIENYLNAHKFEMLVEKEKAPELPQEPCNNPNWCGVACGCD